MSFIVATLFFHWTFSIKKINLQKLKMENFVIIVMQQLKKAFILMKLCFAKHNSEF